MTKGIIENINKQYKEKIEQDDLFISSSHDEHCLIKRSREISYITIICRNKVISEFNSLYGCNLEDLFRARRKFKLPVDITFMIQSNIEFVNSLEEEEWEKCNLILKSTVNSIINSIYLDSLMLNHNAEKWEVILNNLKQNPDFYAYNVNKLCDSLGYSRTQLNRIFMNKYQMTPYDYLVGLKMKYAQSLLSHTDYTISEIAKLVGYVNLNQFNKNFKNIYKSTPLEYRKHAREILP